MKLFNISCVFMLSSCTYTVSMSHTSSDTKDSIDTVSNNKAKVSPVVIIRHYNTGSSVGL